MDCLGLGLIILPGPNRELPEYEEQEIRLTEATDLEPAWRSICSKRLYSFPQASPFRGIYSFHDKFSSKHIAGVTEQFLEEAAGYHQKYTDHSYWKRLLTQALSQAGMSAAEKQPFAVLDVGCGSGNTVIPLLEILPNSRIIATDISPQLLVLLRERVQSSDWNRLRLIAMDATEPNFRESALNLIVGGAILHHLSDPSQVINACCQALKPGGHAIFFEAFEQGLVLLRLLYEELIERRSELELTDEVVSVLKLIIADTDVRVRPDKNNEIYEQIDDKWLFTRTYFERLKERFGFSRLQIHPLNPSSSPFSGQLKVHLGLCLGVGEEAVSSQAWDYVRNFERKMSGDFYSELLLEGCIILTK